MGMKDHKNYYINVRMYVIVITQDEYDILVITGVRVPGL